ncbi:Transposon Ty3-I Gag-Pol polyprotein [Araneus ventricosus]|uniref:Transposon Ty3-I Gag-Pol polyprotein n=1 Tax=Araneus ventricosus TaxID=182803 RepID=A0A4Y2IVC8_ARAVE|nr:Transposon Ty3-I Gag-Pol polyprotein [Araneus ventricosus]
MLDLGVIEVGESNFSSPLILGEAPGRDPRPCIDYRKLNSVTRAEYFPLPKIQERVEAVASAKYITVIELTKGYWQIPLSPQAQRYAAFSTPFGSYRPLTMPFGLLNAPYCFSLEGGGGLITAGESSKSSDMLYSKASSSDAEEELISASASDSRDCLKSVKSGEAKAASLTGATHGEEEISVLVIGGDALLVESEGLEIETIEISLFLSAEGAEIDFFAAETEIVEIGSPSWQIVSEIQTLTDPEQWFHCRGKENPADLLSRGESAVNLVKSSLWAHGPSWLSQPECDWPMKQQREIDEESVLSEKRSQPVKALQVSDKNAEISYPTRFIPFQ